MSWWTAPWSWSSIGLATLLGLALCEVNLLLTSAVLHRGMTHRAVSYPRWLERGVALWLYGTACVPILTWIAAHKHHHANADREGDPHSPVLHGVWRVLLLTWYYVPRWSRAHRDYSESHYLRPYRGERLLHLLDRTGPAYANFWVQLVGSVLLGPAMTAFWIVRVVPYMLASGYINSVGHAYGARPYDNLGTDAERPWQKLFGYLIAGEPLGHNFHHRFPRSPTFRPDGPDPGHWFAVRLLRGVPAPIPERVAAEGR